MSQQTSTQQTSSTTAKQSKTRTAAERLALAVAKHAKCQARLDKAMATAAKAESQLAKHAANVQALTVLVQGEEHKANAKREATLAKECKAQYVAIRLTAGLSKAKAKAKAKPAMGMDTPEDTGRALANAIAESQQRAAATTIVAQPVTAASIDADVAKTAPVLTMSSAAQTTPAPKPEPAAHTETSVVAHYRKLAKALNVSADGIMEMGGIRRVEMLCEERLSGIAKNKQALIAVLEDMGGRIPKGASPKSLLTTIRG